MRVLRLSLLALLLLAGCAGVPPPLYVPFGQVGGYGYTEQQLSETRLRVRYEAPTDTDYGSGRIDRERQSNALVSLAYDMALLRAAELALARGYPAFAVTERQNDVAVEVEPTYPYHHDPFLFHGPFGHRGHRFFYPHAYSFDRQSTYGAGVTLLIELRRTSGPETLDASGTIGRLRAKHPTALTPPTAG